MAHKITCSNVMSTENKTGLEVRHTFRTSRQLSETFNTLIEEGGFNRSAVIRGLLESWIDKQSALLGAKR